MNTFNLSILTPDNIIYKAAVLSVIVPSKNGYWGILASHAPLIAELVPGKISIKEPSGKEINFQSNDLGFAEVNKNQVTILLDKFDQPSKN